MGTRFRLRRLVAVVAIAVCCLDASLAIARETQVYFGDTHTHTNLSLDAGMAGGRDSFGPEVAYRFATGQPIELSDGTIAKIGRPLDFLVVSDHAEYLGVVRHVVAGDERVRSTWSGTLWYWLTRLPKALGVLSTFYVGSTAFEGETWIDPELADEIVRDAWREQSALADQYDDPGTFSAMIGFEWSAAPGYNLHRNVVFRDGGARTTRVRPFSALDSLDPEALWAWMSDYERETGGGVLAIPHNSNLSQGMFFGERDFAGELIDRDYAEARARWEPIIEVTQTKGDSETHPILSPDDPFADYERWDVGMTEPRAFRDSYARSSLGLGLAIDARVGVNPYAFGFIGSTDQHTAFGNAEEDEFWGISLRHLPGEEGRTMEGFLPLPGIPLKNAHAAASGYAGVWAEANTRAALFDAMKRREVFATTGSRIAVRLFGGWAFEAKDATGEALAERGYAGGVPMGGVLEPAPSAGAAPRFLVAATMDPSSAHLDRIQIVKGWLDANGVPQERVFDAVVSGGRTIPEKGFAPPVGSTVDAARGTFENSIGAAQLAGIWTDPTFDPTQRAFYYARVLEIPTPRWTTIEAVRHGVPLPESTPESIQERAYTSPIWFDPTRD